MKRAVFGFILILLIFTFSSCSQSGRPDYELLSDRLSQINEHYAFEYFDMFLYEGSYHVYFSLCSQDDVMLSIQLDDNCNIENVTVTADKGKMTTDGEKNAYKTFASAVISAFCELSESEKKELSNTMSYENINFYFSDLYETYDALRYSFIFSSNSQSINLYCEYVNVIEPETEN